MLYRGLAAAHIFCSDKQDAIVNAAEELGKLKESILPKSQVIEVLKYPGVVIGLLVLLGFMRGPQLPLWLSIALGCLFSAAYVWVSKFKQGVFEWKIPIRVGGGEHTSVSTASVYSLEARLFGLIGGTAGRRSTSVYVVLQLLAGITAEIGGLIFLFELGRASASFAWVAGVDLAIAYFFIYEPVKELRRHRQRASSNVPRRSNAMAYAFAASIGIFFVEFVIALCQGGFSLVAEFVSLLGQSADYVSSHPAGQGMSEFVSIANHSDLAAVLFRTWFVLTFLIVLAAALYEFLIFPTLYDPKVKSSLAQGVRDLSEGLAFIRQSLLSK